MFLPKKKKKDFHSMSWGPNRHRAISFLPYIYSTTLYHDPGDATSPKAVQNA